MITTSLNFQIEKTKDNYEIIKIENEDKWIYIGSKYNMKAEIEKFINNIIDESEINQKIFLIFGFATGEHIKALRKKCEKNSIIVFEPNKKIFDNINNLEWTKNDENLLVKCCEKNELIDNIKAVVGEFRISDVEYLCFSNYDRIYRTEIKEFIDAIKTSLQDLQIDRNTRIKLGEFWFDNFIQNLSYIIKGTPAEMYDKLYGGKPAIIVSAGPSLEKNVDQLEDVNNEMFIISGGRTLKGLLDKKIQPHLLAVMDPGERSYELVEGYIDKIDSPLLFFEKTNSKIVSNHKGKKIFYTESNMIKRIAEKEVKSYSRGGSVAHTMTAYAASIGCNPIIFIGQDLAYTNDKSYSSISGNRDGSWQLEEVKRSDDLFVEGIDGKIIRTSISLNNFRRNLEKIIRSFPDTTFINATEGGARIDGTIEISLNEAIKKYRGQKIEPFKEIHYDIDMESNAIEILKETLKSGKYIIDKCKISLKYIEDLKMAYLIKNNSKVNEILKKLDNIDEEIKEKYEAVTLIGSLIYPIIYDTLVLKTNEKNISKLDEMQFIIDKNKNLYSTILNKLEYSNNCIEKLLGQLKK